MMNAEYICQVLAHLLDMVFYSDEKERVIPLLVNIMHYVVPYLRNHRWAWAFNYFVITQICFTWWWNTWNESNIFMLRRSRSCACFIRFCFSWQCSQRPQLPGLHPTIEQPQRVPVHASRLEEGGLRPLHGPHLLPDGFLLRQPVSRRRKLDSVWVTFTADVNMQPEWERKQTHELEMSSRISLDWHMLLPRVNLSQYFWIIHLTTASYSSFFSWRAIIDHLMTHDKTTFRDLMSKLYSSYYF